MKALAFTIILFFLTSAKGFSQPGFYYYYSPTIGGATYGVPRVSIISDGGIIGFNGLLLYKIDFNGNMLWQKEIQIGSISSTLAENMCLLSDSTLAIVLDADSFNDDFVVIKCDLSGNLIWAKVYSCPNIMVPGSLNLVPYGNGGVMVSCSYWLTLINVTGSVDNAFAFSFPFPSDLFALQATSKVPGSYTFWGILWPSSVGSFFIFDIDTLGIISNYFTYSIAGETLNSGTPPYYNLISRTPSGGTYCTYGLQNKFAVFHFDSQNQPIWVKGVSLFNGQSPRLIYACEDNGCVIAASGTKPLVLKLDSAGMLKAYKTPGVTSYYVDILSMVPDTGSGWYSTISGNNLYLARMDSLFYGLCNQESNYPTINSLAFTSNPQSASSIALAFTNWDLNPTTVSHNFYRYDACSGVLIDSSTSISEAALINSNILIYPNPAVEKITIKFPENVMNGTIYIFNLLGEILLENTFYNQAEKDIWLDKLPSGIYSIHVNDGHMHYSQKFVVQKE